MCKTTFFLRNKTLRVNGKLLDISSPIVMGILNLSENSFYDGGLYNTGAKILKRVEELISEETDIIDIGAVSTKPGSTPIEQNEEVKKICQAISIIKHNFPNVILSVDTYRSLVADASINEGADIINDISGGQFDTDMFTVVAKHKIPYILMHTQGTPDIMQEKPMYNNVVHDLAAYFFYKICELRKIGVHDVIIDVGFGFGKSLQHNFQLLNSLDFFRIFEVPILVGVSRKSMIWKTLNIEPKDALNGSSVINTIALLKGANILRVHDVREAKEAIKLVSQLEKA